jgi:hypothetical protein
MFQRGNAAPKIAFHRVTHFAELPGAVETHPCQHVIAAHEPP